jgi:capsular polysaccharide biosynthesis protein
MATDNQNTGGTSDGLVHPHIEIENRSQELHRELSLSEITTIVLRNWPLFLVLLVVTSTIGLSFYKWKNPYVAKTTIIINDNQNSQLQSFSMTLAGNAKTNEAKKANSTAQKNLEYFKTTDFLQKILDAANTPSSNFQMTLAEKTGQNLFNALILNKKTSLTEDEKLKAYQKLDKMLSFKVKSDYEVEISASDDQKELALYVTNLTSTIALQSLKGREAFEIQEINDHLAKEKSVVDAELLELNTKMAKFNDRPENLMSLTSMDKIGEYLSTLKIEKNAVVMKLAENNKLIQTLTASSNGRRESELYGNNGRIQALKLENEQLRSKLGNLQAAFDRTSSEAKGMPYAAQMYDELKKRADLQLARFKELTDGLTKVDALKLAAANKYEILEKSRIDKVSPAVPLTVVLFLAVLMSQVLGSLIIYLRAIWNSNIVTAESTRNVVVLDSHSLDPRVIIENSKIRFRLRHSSIEETDQENGQTKKLGFNFKSKEQ